MKNNRHKTPIWRSQLYVPANNQKFINKAHLRGSDAVILDLEDSLSQKAKKDVLKNLKEIIPTVSQNGTDVLVRINSSRSLYEEELEHCIYPKLNAIVIPKLSKTKHIKRIIKIIDNLEKSRKIKNNIKILGLIEDTRGFFNAKKLSKASKRIISLILGFEDFSLNTRIAPKEEFLIFPKQFLLLICRYSNLIPYGFLDSISDFSNLSKLDKIARKSYEFGFEGSSCIHPSSIPILNNAFTPSKKEEEEAKKVIEVFEECLSKDLNVTKFKNKMIDLPIYKRALKVVQKCEYFRNK